MAATAKRCPRTRNSFHLRLVANKDKKNCFILRFDDKHYMFCEHRLASKRKAGKNGFKQIFSL